MNRHAYANGNSSLPFSRSLSIEPHKYDKPDTKYTLTPLPAPQHGLMVKTDYNLDRRLPMRDGDSSS
jgi:hypothetical protein